MSDADLRLAAMMRLGACAVCGKPQLEPDKLPLFYVIEITRAAFDQPAVKRTAGLEMAFGALGVIMGPDEPLAKVIDGPHRVFVHEECAGDVHHLMTLIPEEPARG